MKVKVSEVAVLNRQTLGKKHSFSTIQYLDTGSITDGIITGFQKFTVGDDDIPSRAQRLVKNNTIVYSTVRPRLRHYGILKNPSENTVVSTGFVTIDANEDKIYPYYLYCHLIKPETIEYFASIADTAVSSYPSIKPDDLGNLEIEIPVDLVIQKKKAKVIEYINNKIELNNRIITVLEAMAKTIYDYWFVQFDFPNAEGKPYRSSGGEMVWNEQLKREIPKGWSVNPLPKHCKIIDCLHSEKPSLVFENEDYYLLQLDNLIDHGLISLVNKYYVSKEMYELWTSRIEVVAGDLVITNAGRVGAIARIPKHVKAGIGRNMTAIRPNDVPACFLYYFFTSSDIARQIKMNTDLGSFFGSLNVRGIKELKIILPPKNMYAILNKFEDYVSPLRSKIELLAQENLELTKLRDWLLPMLMNGQVNVK